MENSNTTPLPNNPAPPPSQGVAVIPDQPTAGESRAVKLLRKVATATAAPKPVEAPPVAAKPVDVPPPPAPPKAPTPPLTQPGEIELDLGEPKAADASTPPPAPPTDALMSDDDIDATTEVKGENFMRLRRKLKATVIERKELASKVDELSKKVTDYETGLVAPEEVTTLRNRVAELEVYERVHNFKSSPAYQTNFVEPMAMAKSEFDERAVAYGFEPEQLEHILGIESEVELNKALLRTVGEIGALEMKSAVKKIRDIRNRSAQALKDPAKVEAELQDQHRSIMEIRNARKGELMANNAKNSWVNSLLSVREAGEFPELAFIEGNSEHNEKVAKPLLQRAAAEYSRLVRDITKSVQDSVPLPTDALYAIANMVQRAYTASVASYERQQLKDELARVRRTIAENNAIDRPGASGMNIGGAGGAPVPARNGGVLGAARRSLAKVTGG